MKHVLYLLAAVILLTHAPAALAQAAAAGRGAAQATALNLAFYTSEFDIMSQQLTLTDDQKSKVQDKIATMNKEIDAFLANAPAQIAAARRGARGAGGAGGRGAAATTAPANPNPAVLKLQDDLQTLVNVHQVLINQVLTPEQRLAWESYKLHRVLDARLQPLGLTDDQKDKVASLVEAAAKSLADLSDGKSIQPLQGQLLRKIFSDVLTDTQLGKYMEGTLPIQGAAARGAGAVRGATTVPAIEPLP
jgi:hypothetical protein